MLSLIDASVVACLVAFFVILWLVSRRPYQPVRPRLPSAERRYETVRDQYGKLVYVRQPYPFGGLPIKGQWFIWNYESFTVAMDSVQDGDEIFTAVNRSGVQRKPTPPLATDWEKDLLS